MDEIEKRVLGCFANVFPEIPDQDLRRVSQASIASWDSVRQVTLLAALAEEFEFPLDYEAAEEIRSFDLAVAFVREQVHG